jgi:hypothetical protein
VNKKVTVGLVLLGCAGALWMFRDFREAKTNAEPAIELSNVGIPSVQLTRAQVVQSSPVAVDYPVPKPLAPGQITATENASAFRESMCACETQSCIDDANHRFTKAMGKVAASTNGPEAQAEMRVGRACLEQVLARLKE